jgi:phosphoribosyl 1,2-cyclic phosphate phosphodiesterase
VVDAGPDFRQQMLRERVSRIDAIVFTHEHKDHIAGLDDIRAFNYLQKQALPVYATSRVISALKREFAYVFDEIQYPGLPQIQLIEIDPHKAFMVGDLELLPIPVMHLNLPVLGFKIGNFCYITDANFIPQSTLPLIKNCDVLILNALRHQAHPSHFTLSEAIGVAQSINAKKVFFTHISHQLGLHSEQNALLPDNMQLAFDGLSINL